MAQKIQSFIKENKMICAVVLPTAIAIIVSAVIGGVSILKILPLMVSLIIMLMQSSANRYAFLLGSLNSVLYAIVYVSFTLYSSAINALLLSLPIQLITFIRWNKHACKQSTIFRKMSQRVIILTLVGSGLCFVLMNFMLSSFGSPYMVLDNLQFVISTLNYILCFLAFIEYPYLQVLGAVISTVIYVSMIADDPASIPYLIYSLYSLICVTRAVFAVRAAYKEQQENSGKHEQ